MSLSHDVRVGSQRPRLLSLPANRRGSAGLEAVDLAAQAGLVLDDWQQWCLEHALAEQDDGQWSAFEVAIFVSRQCGKGSILEARQLAGLTLLNEQLQVHTSHEFKTCFEHFLRMVQLAESCPDVDRQIMRIRRGAGEQSIEMKSGNRLRFIARSGGSGRGMSGDAVYLDEAFALTASMMGALLPTLSARPNPQLWYTSSAPLSTSVVLHGVRDRGLKGVSPRLFFAEWSVVEGTAPDDIEAWYRAVPALGIRISEEFVHAELDALRNTPDEFLRERLGIPDPLPSARELKAKIPFDQWHDSLTGRPPTVVPGELSMAFDVVDGWASVSIATGTLGSAYVECIAHQAGVGWIPARLVELIDKWKPVAVGLDGGCGPAVAALGEVREALQAADLDPDLVKPLTSAEYKQACGSFFQAVTSGNVKRPMVEPDQLETAGRQAAERVIGDAFVWDRRSATVPLSPLVSATIARALLPVSANSSEPMFAFSK